jgi:hypothetical protein
MHGKTTIKIVVPGVHNVLNRSIVKSINMKVSVDLCSDFAFVRVFEAEEPSVSIFVVGKIKVYFAGCFTKTP